MKKLILIVPFISSISFATDGFKQDKQELFENKKIEIDYLTKCNLRVESSFDRDVDRCRGREESEFQECMDRAEKRKLESLNQCLRMFGEKDETK